MFVHSEEAYVAAEKAELLGQFDINNGGSKPPPYRYNITLVGTAIVAVCEFGFYNSSASHSFGTSLYTREAERTN